MNLIKKSILLILVVAGLIVQAGCAGLFKNADHGPESSHSADPQDQQGASPLPIDPYEQAAEIQITLYFKHEIADFRVPEQRTVMQEKRAPSRLLWRSC